MIAVGKQPDGKWGKLSVLLPILLAATIYLFSTAGRAVTDYDEGYYAQVAKGMAEHGDWVTPYANGIRFLEKPPLLYWLTAGSFKIFGINEFALRLPTALGLIALVWVVMLIARSVADERVVFIAGLSTAFSVGTYLFTRETLHDIWLTLFVALAMHAFFKWYLEPLHSLRPALLFYAAMAGAVMCKSLVGMAFPVGIAAVFLLVSRERPKWRTLHVLPGSLLFLALTVPWHWLAAIRNKDFLEFFFVGEQFLRFFGKREPPVLWSVPLFTFWALILVWFFPWTAFLPAAFSAGRKCEDRRQRMLVKLAWTWAGFILVFFSFSDRLEHYTFPALPALSLLVAVALSKKGESKSISWAFRGLAVLGILAVAAGVGAGIWLASGHGFQFNAAGPTDRLTETDFSIMADMPPVILANLLKPAVVTMISLAIGFLFAFRFEMRSQRLPAVLSVVAVMMVVCGMTHWSLNICEDLISSKKFAIAIAREAHPGDRLIVVGDYESANSLNFYEPLRVEVFDGTAYALIPGMKYPDAPRIILTEREFRQAWKSPERVFVLAPKARLGELNLGGTEMIGVLHRVLLRNH
jgi:hypothetical protein